MWSLSLQSVFFPRHFFFGIWRPSYLMEFLALPVGIHLTDTVQFPGLGDVSISTAHSGSLDIATAAQTVAIRSLAKKTITFRSWDSRILSVLPRRLAVRFPALLTHRSAILEDLFMFMRSCFQSGMGAKQFSDALRVLENPRVLKAGRAVSGDLKYLEQATHPSRPFVGTVDLAKMAKDRLVTTNAKIGLADLCAVTLGLQLDKHVTEHVSSSWENEELSQSQIRYAALDVYTSSRIHKFLSSIPIPVVLPKTVEVGTPVLLFNDDRTCLIARGSIERLEGLFNMGNIRPDGTPDIINISPSRCLVQISDIVVPTAVLKVHNKTPLPSFGSVPFTLLLEEINAATPSDRTIINNHESDSESRQLGKQTLQLAAAHSIIWLTCIRSRVLKDAFHIFNMFYISRQNPLQTWEMLLRKSPDWVLRRCKHIIPPPEQLHGDVAEVFHTFGPLKDATTGLPLFNAAAWAVAKNVLELFSKGYLSDPPGIALYFQLGIDPKSGLPLYRCIRGTNTTEGGVHTHLRSRLPTSGVSVRHVNACLKDFILRHNLLVGTFNSTGKRFTGHYSIWLTNEIQELTSSLEDILVDPIPLMGWVNGNLYEPTNGVAGVLPIPADIRVKSGMAQFEASLHSKQRHRYLAALQGTRKPVLPIHSPAEKDLFHDLMAANPANFSSPSGIDELVRLWNSHANIKKDISYKLSEQLKVYFNRDWKTNTNIKQTIVMTADARAALNARLRNPVRALAAPKVPETQLTLHSVSHGTLPLFDEPPAQHELDILDHLATQQISYSGLSSRSSAPSVIASTYFVAGSSSSAENLTVPDRPLLQQLARKHVMAGLPPRPEPKKRKTRTCRKCGEPQCKGKRGWKDCQNKCRDCRKSGWDWSCQGRNPDKPLVKCVDVVW
ncbi:hypothetical protein B0H10DRAFT_2254857 [Mycena sp. CBHHK59/15]|nr:hypothetical protein B0H10DRAFT_2254857 [Mycena sp. CBHHK59/15]